MNLTTIIQQCCHQNIKAQAEVYQLYSAKLFALCLKYSKNYEDAQDTLQDSFMVIFKKIKQYDHKGSFEGWMKRVAINTALQKYRQKSPLQLIKEEAIEEVEDVYYDESEVNVDFLLSCIQELPDRYRLVFNLYVLDKFSHKEISEMLKISEGTSKSNLSRARLSLKQKIEAHQKVQKEA
ncbi:RNA polymerase sigma-70 factor, ECF subfamily [Tenacibaculum sp. MAR_2009_124]|uniref:RNA polymerase sigma factor n=1 Tax=Tenacibaculum sp. MAR_2009_124 TaxID=1250059 RepID=UPI000896D147|nr:RNA polymerase sigma factor [Tenacibaculum sp. MAR_2009_124]SEC48062.1 RNA polymerase sigma-70 factor, ECF subfamily [Tenacibaculum sp. MAR_2009_124]